MERRWEEALNNQRRLEEEYDRYRRDQPAELSEEELARITALSGDIPALWDAPATTPAERKEIIRLLIERVVVHVRKDSEHVNVEIHWRGGIASRHEVIRPVQLHEHLRDHAQLFDRLAQFAARGSRRMRSQPGSMRKASARRRLPVVIRRCR